MRSKDSLLLENEPTDNTTQTIHLAPIEKEATCHRHQKKIEVWIILKTKSFPVDHLLKDIERKYYLRNL